MARTDTAVVVQEVPACLCDDQLPCLLHERCFLVLWRIGCSTWHWLTSIAAAGAFCGHKPGGGNAQFASKLYEVCCCHQLFDYCLNDLMAVKVLLWSVSAKCFWIVLTISSHMIITYDHHIHIKLPPRAIDSSTTSPHLTWTCDSQMRSYGLLKAHGENDTVILRAIGHTVAG